MEKNLVECHRAIIKQEKKENNHFFMSRSDIAKIPNDRVVTYARVVVDCRSQKKDPNRVRITAVGNLIKCPGDLTCRTADLTTSNILWNSVLSTEGAKFMGLDVGNFYLETPWKGTSTRKYR